MNRLLLFLFLMVGVSCGRQTAVCVNPLTYTDIPDPDVVRVGEDYYMVSTTMYYCPMVPIMQSRDLVHWRIISYVTDCIADDDRYNLRNGKNAYGAGQWATSLRYHDGHWYILFIANDQGKTYIFRTDDVGRSNWEKIAELDRFFYDASLLFDDDGRVYVAHGNTGINVTELLPDVTGVKPGGFDKKVFRGPTEGFGLSAEGSRFYHIGNYYYILTIDWPVNGIRTERCWRSKTLDGTWESKAVSEGTIGGRKDGVAQGAIVETQYGDWYAIVFQDHGAVGRVPTLQPVTWTDDWPMMGNGGRPLETVEVKLASDGDNYVWAEDEFDKTELAFVWQWNHKPLEACWSLSERPGWLRLTTGQLATSLSDARNTLTQRTVGPHCTSEVMLDASALKEGDYAGISAFQSRRCSIGALCTKNGLEVCAVGEAPALGGEKKSVSEVIFSRPLQGNLLWLRIRYDFDEDQAYISYSEDGNIWEDVDYVQKMRFSLDYFTGYRTALFNYATKSLGGYADFDYFHQKID